MILTKNIIVIDKGMMENSQYDLFLTATVPITSNIPWVGQVR